MRRGAKLSVLTAALLFGLGATAVFADGGTLDVEVANNTQYANDQTTDGAIVEYIGSGHTDFGSSGSGVFEAFLRTHASPSEEGYNKDATKASPFEFDEVGGGFTHSIPVSDIPVVECESVDGNVSEDGLCWELFADINDSNSTPLIQLTDLELYFTADPSLNGYPFLGTATKVYDFEGVIQINDVNPGSGRGDLRYLVPLDGITIPDDCDYGNSACSTYFVVYTQWGDPEDGDYSTDAGFNEWKVKEYPFLSVEKSATTTFTRTFAWTIDKSVSPDMWDLFDGDTGTSDWTVAVTKDDGTDSAWAVSGTITIDNPSDQDAMIESVEDAISGAGDATVDCGVTFPYELASGGTLECTYGSNLPDGASRTNTASAKLVDGPVFTGDAAVTFGDPTTLVNDTVDVTDTNGMSWDDISGDDSFSYPETFACDADEGTHDNTATITQTGQSDGASVTVNCYDLDVTKTANESFSRDFDWTVEKSVDPTVVDLFNGDSDMVEWTVTWTKSAPQDSQYAVSGTITIDNNHPSKTATINSVTDSISGVGLIAVDCDPVTAGSQASGTVAAGGSLVCTYSSNLPDGTTRTNTATVVQQNYDYASDGTPSAGGTTQYGDTESIDFTGVTPTVTDNTATLSDARPGNTVNGDNVSTSGSESWNETFTCDADEGDHTNDVLITEDDSLDTDPGSATTTVNCYGLTVTKDADTSFDRDYDWTIDKTRVIAPGEDDGDGDPTTLNLDPDQVYALTYEITVDIDSFTDSNHAVEGTITVANPAPIDANGVVVTDVISGVGAADNLDCDPIAAGEQTTVNILAGGSVDCEYSSALPDATDRTNTATAALLGEDYTGDADVDFENADITEIDECITVVDDNGTPLNELDDTPLGTVCADDTLPHTFTNAIDVGPFGSDNCGPNQFTNTASYTTDDDGNDTDESGSDPYIVIIDVRCPEGCTLTPGYWKTHNATFPGGAPEDPNWFLLGDVDGDANSEGEGEDFFDTGLTWYEVLWESPAGRPFYQLAFHYAAAYLNKLSIEAEGGSIPSHVQDALDDAAALLDEYDGSEIGKDPDIKGKGAKDVRADFVSLAGVLGSFNEGNEGIPHCDEDGTSSAWVLLPLALFGTYSGWRWRRGRHEHTFEGDL